MLRNYWYIACASSRLTDTPRASRVLDQDLVLYRDDDGRAHALLDRCCHRGVRLSLGTVTDGHLACGYHGWQFASSGQCVHVPSLPHGSRIPKTFCVPAFRCVEQDGYIWVWTGEGEPLPALPAAIPGFAESAWDQGAYDYDCEAIRLIENQFDACHPTFTHKDSHPAYVVHKVRGFREYVFETRVTDEGLIAFFPPTDSEADPVPAQPVSATELQLPGRILLTQKILPFTFNLVLHVIATGERTCRLEYLQKKRGPDHVVNWIEEEPIIATQDRIIESSQPWYDLCGDDFEVSVESDYPMLMLRKIFRLAGQGGWMGEQSGLSRRRLINVRN